MVSNNKHHLGSGDDVGCLKMCVHFQSDVGLSDDVLPCSSALNDTQLEHLEKDKTTLYEKEVASLLFASFQESPSFKDKSNSIFDSEEVEADVFKENYSFDRHNYHEVAVPGSVNGSVLQGFGLVSGLYSNYGLPPHLGMGETACRQRHYPPDGFGSSGSVPYSSFMSSSSSYFSRKEDTSATRNSSPFVESDAIKISNLSTSKDSLISSKYKSSIVPYNWEPSVPFRPSFSIPTMIRRSSDVQYDPFYDSIEQPDACRFSSHNPSEFSDRRGSIFEDVQSISGRNSLETNKKLHYDIWDKNYYGRSKDAAPVAGESAATSTSDVQNKNIFEEENPVVPASVKDMLKGNINADDINCSLQSDRMGDGKVIVTDKEQNSSHLDEEESKVIKYFRAAFIEFVQELMRPVWHEGHLSKDVYKVIVQKAEDKILCTLPSDKVPNASELIKQYLSLSRPKILKLIQAYV